MSAAPASFPIGTLIAPSPAPDREPVRVKELNERERRKLLMHFLALETEDRSLRFGAAVDDDTVTRYVQRLDFTRDAVFGVYDEELQLVGVGHLAFSARDAYPLLHKATEKNQIAELGVSVLPAARGIGVGRALFERAAIHCRNRDVDTLTMQCLASNQPMMRIARKAGMDIHTEYGEANAFLKLRPADPVSVMREAMQEQAASFDYTLKLNSRFARHWWRRFK